MREIINIINSIANTNSRNEKEAVLQKHKDNDLFKKILQYTYDDSKMYGFSEKKLRELLQEFINIKYKIWNNVFDMLDILVYSNINDELRANVCAYLNSQDEDVKELYIKILTKDLRCNISAKTINKVIKNLIKTWEIQQAYPIDSTKLKKNEWICLPLKLNGIRTSFLSGEFRSRQNKLMYGYNHILEDIKALGIDHMFVDGELIRKNFNNISDNENFRLTTSIVNSDLEEKTNIEMVIFDITTKEDFAKGESKDTFKTRLNLLIELQNKIQALGLKHIRIMPIYYTGTDHSQIQKYLDYVDSLGYEGLMCIRDMPYQRKRHKGILKVKSFKSADLKIIGFTEGEGKYQGTLGAIIVEYKGNTINVGSGYTDEQRKQIWDNKDSLLGRVVEVKYKEESQDKTTGLYSLQFPIFICIREEGKEISYN